MNKEVVLIIAMIVSLAIIVYTFKSIDKLQVSKSYKVTLYYLTILIPVLGLLLMLRARQKFR